MKLFLWFQPFDEMCARWVHSHRIPALNRVMLVIAHIGDFGGVWMLLSLITMSNKSWRERGARLMFCLLLTGLVNNLILKNIFARERPFKTLSWSTTLISRPADNSFPSGHTASSFAAAFVLWCGFGWMAGLPSLTVALLIGYSRMYVGVHYMSDVIAGAFTGLLCGAAGWGISHDKYDEIVERLRAWRR